MLPESLTWGTLPDGFAKLSDGNGNRMIVRRDRQAEIKFVHCLNPIDNTDPSPYQGRASLGVVPLSDGERALVRRYCHGGALRAFTGAWYFTWPPRPFRELLITEELRLRGLRTAEVYAACVSRRCGPFYLGWLVTKELRGAKDLWLALQQGVIEKFGEAALWRAVADSIRTMHREGVYHSDLNLKNILLREEATGLVSYIIDFDKAKLFLGKLPTELIKKNLDRLLRSAQKLDPSRRYVSDSAWQSFVDIYYGGSET